MKKCRTIERKLIAYIHGELDQSTLHTVEKHLEGCASCRRELEAHRGVLDLLGVALAGAPAPSELRPWWHLAARKPARVTLADVWYSPQLRAVLITGAAFGVLFFISLSIVVFPAMMKQRDRYEVTFDAPEPVVRPKMKLSKPKTAVNKSGTPQSSTRIVTKSAPAPSPEVLVAPAARPGPATAYDPRSAGVVVERLALDAVALPALGQKTVDESEVLGRSPMSGSGGFNTEQYSRIVENSFKSVLQNPLSTFSIDVDRASYANVRRFLNSDQMPPPDAVRIEEMINYFDYDYPQPQGEDPFSVTMELAECPWNTGHRLALIGLQGIEIETEDLPPNNLVFLLDVSGSMNHPDKLPLLKSAMRLLVGQLRPEDRVSIVVYAGAAGRVLEPTADKARILEAIDRLHAGGSTAGGAGIMLAYETARESFIKEGNNRVILATDGDFNVGISSDGDLVRLIEEKRETGIFLSVLGFGSGNYKDSKMEQLADKGNGNYAYIDDILEAKKVLVTEMGGTLVAIAKDVKIQIEFNPSQVKAYRLIGYENRILAAEDFDDDKKDAGELGAGHTVTALYELIPADSDESIPTAGNLKYQTARVVPSDEMMTVKLRYKQPDGDTSSLIMNAVSADDIQTLKEGGNMAFVSAVAEFGLLLRNSGFKGAAGYEQVLERAKRSKGTDEAGYRAEFIRLVERAILLDTRNNEYPK